MKSLSRRSVTTGLAAAVTTIPAVGLCKPAEGPSELAALVRRYFAEREAFDTWATANEEADWGAADTYSNTAAQMIGVPVRNAKDALAAMDWLLDEVSEHGEVNFSEDFLYGRVAKSLTNAVRDYLASA